jgi:hypothetical protein
LVVQWRQHNWKLSYVQMIWESRGRSLSTGQMTHSGQKEEGAEKNQLSAPSLSLPKGGGAIRGIGENSLPTQSPALAL